MTFGVRGVSVQAVGMVSPLGLTAASSCAALRARLSRYRELPIHDSAGEPVIGSPAIEAAGGLHGAARIVALLESAIRDCIESYQLRFGSSYGQVAVLISAGDGSRPDCGPELSRRVLEEITRTWSWIVRESSRVYTEGETGFFLALNEARDCLQDGKIEGCIVAAVDSLVNPRAIKWLEEHGRLKTESNSDGVIPAEAAAALWVTLDHRRSPALLEINGLGFANEPSATDSERANTSEGLAEAIRRALADAQMGIQDIDFQVGGMTGERWEFMESSTAIARVLRKHKPQFNLWVPAELLGDVGAALGACMLVAVAYGFLKSYTAGPRALVYRSETGPRRAACVVSQQRGDYYG
jgi:3-oxoacyl-[acyl-carrier-protein] synthase I